MYEAGVRAASRSFASCAGVQRLTSSRAHVAVLPWPLLRRHVSAKSRPNLGQISAKSRPNLGYELRLLGHEQPHAVLADEAVPPERVREDGLQGADSFPPPVFLSPALAGTRGLPTGRGGEEGRGW